MCMVLYNLSMGCVCVLLHTGVAHLQGSRYPKMYVTQSAVSIVREAQAQSGVNVGKEVQYFGLKMN